MASQKNNLDYLEWSAGNEKAVAISCLLTAQGQISDLIEALKNGRQYHGGIHNIHTQLGLAAHAASQYGILKSTAERFAKCGGE